MKIVILPMVPLRWSGTADNFAVKIPRSPVLLGTRLKVVEMVNCVNKKVQQISP